MCCEWPLRRCCLCIPLRFGLLGLGYVKQALDITLLVFIVARLEVIRNKDSVVLMVNVWFLISHLIVDVIMNALFIYGCHKKHPAILRVFYLYCLVMIVINILLALALIVLGIVIYIQSPILFDVVKSYIIINMTMFVLDIILQIFTIIHVISEVKTLESSRKFQFANGMDGRVARG